MKIQSQALEVNLASYHVEVEIDPRYAPLQAVMSKYFGLMDGVNTFLKELSHPYKNWQFIVSEARVYTLDYFHLINRHDQGEAVARLYVEIFLEAVGASRDREVKTDAVDNLLLFLHKIVTDAGAGLGKFLPVISDACRRLAALPEEDFALVAMSYYQLPKIARAFRAADGAPEADYGDLNRLLAHYYRYTFSYFLKADDPQQWFANETDEIKDHAILADIFSEISHNRLKELEEALAQILAEPAAESGVVLDRLLALPTYETFVKVYREVPQKLLGAGAPDGRCSHCKLLFLFHIMNMSGLAMIHEETLREINRTISWLIAHERYRNLSILIQKTFTILKTRTSKFPGTALNCVLNMGKGISKTEESDLVNVFIDALIDLGFQTPGIAGVGNDWQIKVNSAHLQNIRTWLELIELHPKWSTRLLSALIIHLSLGGVFIKDTDLFPREITRFLNSGIGPVYNLAKQLARLFPAYFNDIGAEGRLRDISTRLDELTGRRDVLVHFLRKQSHVESSNRIIGFMEATLKFWETLDKSALEAYLPPSIFEQIAPQGPWVDGMHRVVQHLKGQAVELPAGLLALSEEDLQRLLAEVDGALSRDVERVGLAAIFYKLLHQKYRLDFREIDHYLDQLRTEGFPDLSELKTALAEPAGKRKLALLLNFLEKLKALILSGQEFEIKEDIYKKRHFTVDIPSMYGSYHELKFDALGLTFRIESLVNVLFEELVASIDISLITKATFYQVYDRLLLFNQALKLEGISSLELERQLDFLAHSLEIKGFTFTQYLDIFKGFAQAVKNIINDYFNNVHERNLTKILGQLSPDQILPAYLPVGPLPDAERLKHRVSEVFFREKIAQALGLQQLDLFLSRILNTLFYQADILPKEKLHLLLNYDPQRAMTALNDSNPRAAGIIHLGNKGLNMVRLKNFGLPVPPGFIITTEVFRGLEIVYSFRPAEENFRDQVARHIAALERETGKRFGDPAKPLLFSVRSGSSISQPGMMDTFLNVGMNEEIAAGIAAKTGNTWFAWDNYRRFLQCYGMAFDLVRDDFDAIMKAFKERWGFSHKREFSGEQMKALALAYKKNIQDAGIAVLEDPMEQLHLTIKRVFGSWDSAKAKAYRKIMGISDDWGTAVTVQSMVYGNISPIAGTGVIFTHNPRWYGNILKLWGDFTIGNQGEDVVAGLVQTLPISLSQQEIEMRDTDITLETDYPEIYTALDQWANELIYKHGWSPQEMEFTFESPKVQDLYLLQTRDMAMRELKSVMTFDPSEKTEEKFLGHGIGVSGGAMSGRMVFSLEEIDKWRELEPDTALILVRSDTVPDDIREIYAADGLLTARGGLTSHAAVVAHRLGKTCVVGCGKMVCDEKAGTARFNDLTLTSGGFISVDGQEGSVYRGSLAVRQA
jgi:pyruvate,orthophosphate dikinase